MMKKTRLTPYPYGVPRMASKPIMKRSQGSQKELHKIVLKRRKISKKTISYWKPLTKEKKAFLLSLLNDSMEPFTGSNNDDINAVLQKILLSFKELLHILKVPEDKWLDHNALNLHQRKLLAEQTEVKTQHSELLTIFNEKKRALRKLQFESSRFTDHSSQHLEVSSIFGDMPSASTS